MTTPSKEILIEGRVVCGHPMTRRPVKKKQLGATIETPVIGADGQPVTEAYLALAIPKGAETDWKQTDWGQEFFSKGSQDWPNGEYGAPTFAWKITDGDSQVPNTKNKKPVDREGWAGHWVVHCSTQLAIRCYHVGKYDPTQQIQVEGEIKTGDYARVLVSVKGNGPVSQSPGIYVNPIMFELSRAGAAIISSGGPAALDIFGGTQPNIPANAQMASAVAPVIPTQADSIVPAVAPAPDLLQPGQAQAAPVIPAIVPVEVKYMTTDGGQWTEAQLLAAGYQPAQIKALPRA